MSTLKTTMSKKPIVSAQVEPQARDELVRLARQGDHTLSAELRRAISEHLAREIARPTVRLAPEEAYSLVCDYVRADGWVQDGAGYWSHPEDDKHHPTQPPVPLSSALMIALRYDGISPDTPAPPVAHTFGPRREEP